MSITKCPGHMRSLKLNFSATVLTLGLKAKIFENLRLCQAKFWGELRTRATFDRCVVLGRYVLQVAGCRLQEGCRLKFNYNWKTAGTKKKHTSGRLTVTVTRRYLRSLSKMASKPAEAMGGEYIPMILSLQ